MKKAVDDAKSVFDKEINDSAMEIDRKEPRKYLEQVCEMIQPKVDEVTESLHKKLKENYQSFVVDLKGGKYSNRRYFSILLYTQSGLIHIMLLFPGVFQKHIKRSPKVEER